MRGSVIYEKIAKAITCIYNNVVFDEDLLLKAIKEYRPNFVECRNLIKLLLGHTRKQVCWSSIETKLLHSYCVLYKKKYNKDIVSDVLGMGEFSVELSENISDLGIPDTLKSVLLCSGLTTVASLVDYLNVGGSLESLGLTDKSLYDYFQVLYCISEGYKKKLPSGYYDNLGSVSSLAINEHNKRLLHGVFENLVSLRGLLDSYDTKEFKRDAIMCKLFAGVDYSGVARQLNLSIGATSEKEVTRISLDMAVKYSKNSLYVDNLLYKHKGSLLNVLSAYICYNYSTVEALTNMISVKDVNAFEKSLLKRLEKELPYAV